ncbi:MAG TPA: hypothetical protein VMF67_10280 [Rhizomicrobium sp.]|nr:hypothetical protein [Rhizomicrobium sp.]
MAFACGPLAAGPAVAKASYVTFDGSATSINSGDAAAGYIEIARGIYDGFLRTPDGTVTTFAVSGSNDTEALSINDAGEIAGIYLDSADAAHGFVRAVNGTITTFDGPNASFTVASSINNRGEITGYYYAENVGLDGFVRKASGRIVSFDVPGSVATYPTCINDRGVVVGAYDDTSAHGFIRAADGAFTTFDVSGAAATYPICLNAKGVVAGYYAVEGGSGSGFLRTPDGTITTFGGQDCPARVNYPVYVTSINRKGDITGSCAERDHIRHAIGFLRHADGTFQKFHVLQQGPNTWPSGINNAGVIVGTDANGSFLRFPSRQQDEMRH